MRILKQYILLSVVLALGLCKPLHAAEAEPALSVTEPPSNSSNFWDGFKIGGYTSAGVGIHPDGKTEASVHELSMIVRWEGDSRLRFFSEFELEEPISWKKNQTDSASNFKFDLQRLYFDYNLSESTTMRSGRFLTPAGYWNQVHAAPLVWTTSRPLATSRLFPLAINGVMFYGALPWAKQGMEYTVFSEVVEDLEKDNNEIEFEHTQGVKLNWIGQYNLGLTLMRFTEKSPLLQEFRMLGLDFQVHEHGWEISGEAFQRFQENGNNGGNGGYLQVVAPLFPQWFLIGRTEAFKRPAEGSAERWLVGLAYKINTQSVFKLEYIGGDAERVDAPKGLLSSFAILF